MSAAAATVPGTYMGRATMGNGKQIPINPSTGQVDINALLGNMVDRRKIYYYDTLKLAAGSTVSSTPYRFFQTALGQPDPYNGNAIKTLLETNLEGQGAQFNPPYDLILFNLGFFFWFQDRLFDIQQVMQLSWFEFKILEKRMWWGNIVRHPAGMGMTGYSTQNNESVWTNGSVWPEDVWYFGDYKKYIPPLVNFSLTLNFPEIYNTYYNSNLPAVLTAALGAGIGTSLPSFLAAGSGGNGIQLVAIMNGLSDSPVQ